VNRIVVTGMNVSILLCGKQIIGNCGERLVYEKEKSFPFQQSLFII